MTTAPESGERDGGPGPGAYLQQARVNLRLGLEEVAHRLHMSVRQIEALEQDDYRTLPGPTYVRGYLRNYSSLLGIDPGPVLEAHTRLTAKPSPPPDFSNITPQREVTSRNHQVRFVSYLVAVVVVGLAIAWWQGRNGPPAPPVKPSVAESENPMPVPAPADLAANPAEIDATVERGTVASKPVPPAPTAAATPNQPLAATPAVATTAKPVELLPPPKPPVIQKTEIASGPRGKVVVTADQDSWVDIRDARQVKLLYETVAAGRTVTLEGVLPIQVFLGNAQGARVEYNGQLVNTEPYRRGLVARFTLGTAEEASAPPQ